MTEYCQKKVYTFKARVGDPRIESFRSWAETRPDKFENFGADQTRAKNKIESFGPNQDRKKLRIPGLDLTRAKIKSYGPDKTRIEQF